MFVEHHYLLICWSPLYLLSINWVIMSEGLVQDLYTVLNCLEKRLQSLLSMLQGECSNQSATMTLLL